eukprot:TRINITY_DN2693_c0_g9_i1.p1 TRINITY_DN2693_c0_g9~~TRINITY_DN2693_c0_g9_i1.p1  ORF type:complete len:344 (+),score=45.03 TRINITY_DN2693_c0_g9_i1:41-1033(+)
METSCWRFRGFIFAICILPAICQAQCGYSSCSICTLAYGCGWCSSSGTCVGGSSSGPSTGTCGAWHYTSCPSNCSQHTDCSTCASDYSCGWCSSTSRCVAGTLTGPSSGSCSSWSPTVSSCAVREYLSTSLVAIVAACSVVFAFTVLFLIFFCTSNHPRACCTPSAVPSESFDSQYSIPPPLNFTTVNPQQPAAVMAQAIPYSCQWTSAQQFYSVMPPPSAHWDLQQHMNSPPNSPPQHVNQQLRQQPYEAYVYEMRTFEQPQYEQPVHVQFHGAHGEYPYAMTVQQQQQQQQTSGGGGGAHPLQPLQPMQDQMLPVAPLSLSSLSSAKI